MRRLLLPAMGAALLSSGAASGGFVGVKAVSKPNEGGLFVCSVYAVFDRTDDQLNSVAGTFANPLDIHVVGGQFYQDPEGQPLTAPVEGMLPGMSGLLAFDTFVTIGHKTDNLFYFGDDISVTPGLTFENDRIATTNGSWFTIPCADCYPGAPDENGQVLLFQGSFFLDGGATGLEGQMLLSFYSNGFADQSFVTFTHPIPAPGALLVVGLAAATTTRRRRGEASIDGSVPTGKACPSLVVHADSS